MRTYRAAVVGCGSRSPEHIEAYERIDGAAVVACCAPSGKRRDPLAETYGIAPYADAAEMIRSERPDIVHLVTWPDTRVELMTLVSELGVPLCTVEKPLCATVRDWRAIAKLAATTTTKFAVCHQFRWHPNLVRCRDAIRRRDLGEPTLVDMSAGMNVMGQGTHTLDYGLSLVGDPRVVQVCGTASGWDEDDPRHPAPLSTVAHLTFDNGTRGIWTSGPIAPRCGDPQVVWKHKRVAAYAERGRVLWEQFGRWAIGGLAVDETARQDAPHHVAANHAAAQAGFHEAMLAWDADDARAPGTSLARSLHESATVFALYQSALEQRPVDLDGFDPPDGLVDALRTSLTDVA